MFQSGIKNCGEKFSKATIYTYTPIICWVLLVSRFENRTVIIPLHQELEKKNTFYRGKFLGNVCWFSTFHFGFYQDPELS